MEQHCRHTCRVWTPEPENTNCPLNAANSMVRGRGHQRTSGYCAGAILRAASDPRQMGSVGAPADGAGASSPPKSLTMPSQRCGPGTPWSAAGDHMPYYRQEQINARSECTSPRSSLAAQGSDRVGKLALPVRCTPGFRTGPARAARRRDAHRLVDPGGAARPGLHVGLRQGSIRKYARCGVRLLRRGKSRTSSSRLDGTPVADAYSGYDATLSLEGRKTANRLAHARRCLTNWSCHASRPVAAQAIRRIAWLYRVESDARDLSCEQRCNAPGTRAPGRAACSAATWTHSSVDGAIAMAIDSLEPLVALSSSEKRRVPVDTGFMPISA